MVSTWTPIILALDVDWTIRIDIVALFGAWLLVAGKAALWLRDSIRDMQARFGEIKKQIGSEDPPPGTGLHGKLTRVEHAVDQHRDWLVRAGLDRHGGRH